MTQPRSTIIASIHPHQPVKGHLALRMAMGKDYIA